MPLPTAWKRFPHLPIILNRPPWIWVEQSRQNFQHLSIALCRRALCVLTLPSRPRRFEPEGLRPETNLQ